MPDMFATLSSGPPPAPPNAAPPAGRLPSVEVEQLLHVLVAYPGNAGEPAQP